MRRLVVTVVGLVLILLGVVMIVTPGPGWLTIIAGLGVLSTEYTWARVALEKTEQKYGQAKDQVNKRRRKKAPSPPEEI